MDKLYRWLDRFFGSEYFNVYAAVIIVIAVILMFTLFVPARAQDATQEPPPLATDIPVNEPPQLEPNAPIPLEDAAQTIIEQVLAVISSYGAITGAAATVIIGFLKFVPPLNDPAVISGGMLNVVVNGVLVLGYFICQSVGILPTYLLGLAKVENVGQLLLALVSSILGSFLVHHQSVKAKLPITGKQRN